MTCREKMMLEHPDDVKRGWVGGVAGCPHHVGYLAKPEGCTGEKYDGDICRQCWDRELPDPAEENAKSHIKDSGNRREFETGAVRDIQEGKGRCDLMPMDVVAGILDEPALICISQFKESGERHYLFDIFDFVAPRMFIDISTMLLEVAKHFEEGAKKYGENNWQKGIPVHCYIDSAVRHYLKWLRGDNDEPHDRAFCWNIICAIWTCIHKPELNDYVQ